MNQKIKLINKDQIRDDLAEFNIGDTVRIYTKIVEGDRERVQPFAGVVIARKGKGISETVTLRRVLYGEGVERVFMINSPQIQRIEVERQGEVRRAKIYYLKDRVGKKARVKEKKRTATGK